MPCTTAFTVQIVHATLRHPSALLSAMDIFLLKQKSHLVVLVLVVCLCFFQPTNAGDVVFINDTDSCVDDGEVPSGLSVSSVTNNSAVVHWNPLSSVPSNAVQGYEVLYWPIHSSVFMTELVTGLNVHQTILHDLSPFTEYVVVVRLYCSQQDGVGQASATISFTTEAIEPSAAVTNVTVSLVENDNEVNITWKPLKAGEWNGVPFGYYVYVFTYSQDSMCAGTPMVLDTYQTSRSDTYKNITVNDFCYRVIVFPVNHIAWGPGSIPIYFTFSKIPRELKVIEAPESSPADSTPFLSSPYVYIIVIGVVAVVPIVLGIVLFKKAREKRMKLLYCRGIHGPPFGDIQLHPLSPSSGTASHLSPHASNSRVQAFSPLSNHSPNTPSRPLLASPIPPYTDHNREMTTTHFPMPPIHSPTTPQSQFQQRISPITEGVPAGAGGDAAFMSRNFHLESVGGDVFMAGSNVPPPVRAGPHRPRANTEGGGMNMPSPYEFPIHPGGASTLPRSELGMHSSGVGGTIPPPPNHAPPPLTHSSLEIFARVSRSPPHSGGVNGAAGESHRGMSHRSFSTTHAVGSPTSTVPPNNSMRMIRSASLLHPVEEKDQDGGPDYATVEPPDNNIMFRGRAATLDRQPPPFLNQNNSTTIRSGRNSDDLSSFSEMTADNDSVQLSSVPGHIPPAPNYTPRQPETGVYRPGDQRESVFSETSTEPSISSGSIRETSPSGAPNWTGGEGSMDMKKRHSSSSITPTNSRASSYHQAHHHPPKSPL